jgi:hypothetical protein
MGAAKYAVKPIYVRAFNPALNVDGLRVVGYRAVCDDGRRGQSRDTYAEARDDMRELRESATNEESQ